MILSDIGRPEYEMRELWDAAWGDMCPGIRKHKPKDNNPRIAPREGGCWIISLAVRLTQETATYRATDEFGVEESVVRSLVHSVWVEMEGVQLLFTRCKRMVFFNSHWEDMNTLLHFLIKSGWRVYEILNAELYSRVWTGF